MPSGIELELSTLGIKYDITRRLAKNNSYVTYNGTSVLHQNNNFPIQVEESNDDSANNDEDLIPSAKEIFSYDAPSEDIEVSSRAFSIRKLSFKEFVRVSFDASIGGNATLGSRCSEHYDWELDYGLESGSTNITDPYDPMFHVLTETSGGGVKVSLPRRLIGAGNGSIVINPIGTPAILTYLLELNSSGNQWYLKEKASGNIIGMSNVSTIGPWSISTSSVTVSLSQGGIPFSSGAVFGFNIWDMPSSTNSVTAN